MPIYEFECPEHGVWDGLYKISDESQSKPCPSCGKESRKVVSRSSFELRGEGWYRTNKMNRLGND